MKKFKKLFAGVLCCALAVSTMLTGCSGNKKEEVVIYTNADDEAIEVMKPNGENVTVTVKAITDEHGTPMESCPHPKQKIFVDLGIPLSELDVLRRKEPDA